jgi:hypothetical protein
LSLPVELAGLPIIEPIGSIRNSPPRHAHGPYDEKRHAAGWHEADQGAARALEVKRGKRYVVIVKSSPFRLDLEAPNDPSVGYFPDRRKGSRRLYRRL